MYFEIVRRAGFSHVPWDHAQRRSVIRSGQVCYMPSWGENATFPPTCVCGLGFGVFSVGCQFIFFITGINPFASLAHGLHLSTLRLFQVLHNWSFLMPQLLPPPAPNTHPLLLSFHTEEGLVVLEVCEVAFPSV